MSRYHRERHRNGRFRRRSSLRRWALLAFAAWVVWVPISAWYTEHRAQIIATARWAGPLAAALLALAATLLIRWRLRRRDRYPDDAALPPPAEVRRRARVYAYDTYSPFDWDVIVLGYVGQTVRTLAQRDEEHRETQPWADLIVPGSPRVLWEGDATQVELDGIELAYIRNLRPLYNYRGQERARHAIPKPAAVEQRWARDADAGLPPWQPVVRQPAPYSRRRTAQETAS